MDKVEFEDELSVTDHLAELRTRIMYIVAGLFVSFLICYSLKTPILHLLKKPLPAEYSNLTFLAPADVFFVVIKVSFFSAILLSLPITFYQFWGFIAPALLKKEKTYVLPSVFFSTAFFLVGCMFAYYIILPLGLSFLLNYGAQFGTPNITLENYLSFTVKLILAFGVVFELPVIVGLLSKLGIINSHTLTKNRGIGIVLIFIVSAILTPPDPATMIMMSIPLMVLFEISIYVAKLFEKKK